MTEMSSRLVRDRYILLRPLHHACPGLLARAVGSCLVSVPSGVYTHTLAKCSVAQNSARHSEYVQTLVMTTHYMFKPR